MTIIPNQRPVVNRPCPLFRGNPILPSFHGGGGSGPPPYVEPSYFSSTARMPMGQALAQMPQAMHLLTLSAPGARTKIGRAHV